MKHHLSLALILSLLFCGEASAQEIGPSRFATADSSTHSNARYRLEVLGGTLAAPIGFYAGAFTGAVLYSALDCPFSSDGDRDTGGDAFGCAADGLLVGAAVGAGLAVPTAIYLIHGRGGELMPAWMLSTAFAAAGVAFMTSSTDLKLELTMGATVLAQLVSSMWLIHTGNPDLAREP